MRYISPYRPFSSVNPIFHLPLAPYFYLSLSQSLIYIHSSLSPLPHFLSNYTSPLPPSRTPSHPHTPPPSLTHPFPPSHTPSHPHTSPLPPAHTPSHPHTSPPTLTHPFPPSHTPSQPHTSSLTNLLSPSLLREYSHHLSVTISQYVTLSTWIREYSLPSTVSPYNPSSLSPTLHHTSGLLFIAIKRVSSEKLLRSGITPLVKGVVLQYIRW